MLLCGILATFVLQMGWEWGFWVQVLKGKVIFLMNQDPSRYGKSGYCVFPGCVEHSKVLEIREELDSLIANMPAEQEVFSGGEMVKKKARTEYLTEPHSRSAFWLELCRHPKILGAVESVLGPDLMLIMSHLIVKSPHDGLAVNWHQDNTYWPSVTGTDVGTVWLAIDDVDQQNGCMQVIPSSHDGYRELETRRTDGNDLLGVEAVVSEAMLASAVPIILTAGSLSIHDSFILHGSEANTSARRRAGYTMRYANMRTVEVDVKQHWVDVFCVKGSDKFIKPGYIDIREGRPLPSIG